MKLAQLILEGITYSNPNFSAEWEEANRYPEFEEMGKQGWIDIAKNGYVTSYSKIKNVLGNVDLDFESLEEPKKQRFQDAFKRGTIEMSIAVKFSDNDYDLIAGNTRLSGLVKNGIDPKLWIVDISDLQENSANDTGIFKFQITDKVHDEGDNSLITVEYKFNTSEDTYRVEFYSGEYDSEAKIFDLAFGLDREGSYKLDTFQMTGKGQVKKILQTLTAIIQDFLTKFDVEKVNIFPTDEKRRRVYKAVIGGISKVEIHENFADGKVNEIGDLSQTPYKFTKLPSSKKSPYTYYKFITDSGTTYEVVLERDETEIATTYNIAFTAKGKHSDEFSASTLTGGNEPLKIMSTVVDITKKHIDKVDDADYIVFEPTKGKQGEEGSSNTRAKLYKLVIKKNFPQVKVIADDDTVLVDLEGYYDMQENFADGKVKGKSRPGRVKKAGASCKGSVTDLRAKAKKYGGEKGKMYHWCANMKSNKK